MRPAIGRGSSRPSAPPRAKPSTTALRELSAAVLDVARHLLASGLDAPGEKTLAHWREGILALRAPLREFLSPSETAQWDERRRRLAESGLPPELADDVASFPLADRGLNVVRILERTGLPARRGRPASTRASARAPASTGSTSVCRPPRPRTPGTAW